MLKRGPLEREWQTNSASLPWEPHEQYEKEKRYDTERWTPQVGRCPVYLALGKEPRNSSRRNEEALPKWKRCPIVYVFGGESKVLCCKEQYCIGTYNVRSMNRGKLEVVKQETARVNINILRINELKWTRMDEFNSDDHYIYYCEQESFRRNGVALIVNKRIQNAVLGHNLKNNRIISVHFQGKLFSITIIQSMPQSLMPKKMKLNGSMNTYKTF